VLFDGGEYRNARSHHVHGWLGRDGVPPEVLRASAWDEIARYGTVERRARCVVTARRDAGEFVLDADDGSRVRCRKVLLATGMVDVLPPVPGAADLLGEGVYVCPYCDGWELRDQPLAVHDGRGALALLLTQWSRDLVLCTDGAELDAETQGRVDRRGVAVDRRRVSRIERSDGGVAVVFDTGPPLERRAVFARVEHRPRSDLARQLGCVETPHGVEANRYEGTDVAGVYVAGDASRDVLMAMVAAGEGAAAAVAINAALDAET
jgi:thioredoxin reductase